MKGNIKKLTILMMVIATVSFIWTATAPADHKPTRYSLQGTYAVSGSGSALIAYCGFIVVPSPFCPTCIGESGVPWCSETGQYSTWQFIFEGFSTFRRDGTGKSTMSIQFTSWPPTITFPPNNAPYIGEQLIEAEFTYTMARDGAITLTDVVRNSSWISGPQCYFDPSGCPTSPQPQWLSTSYGRVSSDKQTINVSMQRGYIAVPNVDVRVCPADARPPWIDPTQWPLDTQMRISGSSTAILIGD
jgi:hypothetical protein